MAQTEEQRERESAALEQSSNHTAEGGPKGASAPKPCFESWEPELVGGASCCGRGESCLGSDEMVVSQVLVRFNPTRKISLAMHGQLDLEVGDQVVVEADRGTGIATVLRGPVRMLARRRGLRRVLKKVGRSAHGGEQETEQERAAFQIAYRRIQDLGLAMRLVAVERLPGDSKAVFYFNAENRVDFRELVRDLARELSCRIEMRQIGVRDQAKIVGGLGVCGRALCCASFLREFRPVTIRMAKMQGLVLNPQKVSGQCGRLLCCLAYEFEQYREARRGLPKIGTRVETPAGEGRVREVDILRRLVRVNMDGQEQLATFAVDEVWREGTRPVSPPASEPPHPSEPTDTAAQPSQTPDPPAAAEKDEADERPRRRKSRPRGGRRRGVRRAGEGAAVSGAEPPAGKADRAGRSEADGATPNPSGKTSRRRRSRRRSPSTTPKSDT